MFPSTSRVKLNRVSVKDGAGPQPHFPRRKRLSRSPTQVPDERQKAEACGAAVHSGDEPAPSCSTRRGDPDDAGGGEPEHCRGAGRKRRRKVIDGEELPAEGPRTGDKHRNPHPCPTSSQECWRRTVSASSCDLCGDCQYISPQRKTLVKREQKSSNSRSKKISDEFKISKGNPVTGASKEAVIWLDQYAKVTLCDVAQVCDLCSQNCAYVLPDVLKNKVVHCFKCCELTRAGISRKQQKKLYGITKGSMSSTADSKTHSIDKEKTCSQMSGTSQSRLELPFGSRNAHTSSMKENCVHEKPWVQKDKPRETDAAQMSPERFCPSEVDADEPDSSTCQRVRVYNRKKRILCARTCMPWPFSNTSLTLAGNAGSTACQAERVHPSARNDSDSSINQMQSASLSCQTNDVLPNAPTETSSDTAHKVSHQNEENEDGGCITAKRNGKRHGRMSSYSSDSNNMDFKPPFIDTQESFASLLSDSAKHSSPDEMPGTVLALSMPANGPDTDSSISTPSPSVLGLNDWKITTVASPASFVSTHSGLSAHSEFRLDKAKGVESAEDGSACTSPVSPPKPVSSAVEKPLFHCEETPSCPSPTSSFYSSHNYDSGHSWESSLLLLQDWQEKDCFTDSSPPKLEPNDHQSPMKQDHPVDFGNGSSSSQDFIKKTYGETNSSEFVLSPLLSPVTSPQWHMRTSPLPEKHCCLEEDEEGDIDASKRSTLRGHHMPPIGEGGHQNNKENLDRHQHEGHAEEMEAVSSKFKIMNDDFREGSQDNTITEDDVAQSDRSLSEPLSSPSSDDGLNPSEMDEMKTDAQATGGTECSFLDEFTAYEQDILLLSVTQDPELFENLPEQSLIKLGPNRVRDAPKTRPAGAVNTQSSKWTSVIVDFHNESPDNTDENNSRPWRPQCKRNPSTITVNFDANNNVNRRLERSKPIQAVNPPHNIPAHRILKNGPSIPNLAKGTDFWHQKSTAYCRKYFSESLSCGFKMCRFQHVPLDGDEKFCVDTLTRFIKIPASLQKAGAIFTGYYQNNPPGAFFSMPVFVSLLWSLLKASMVPDILSVLTVSLAHKIAPGHEFLLALFDLVKEKGLVGYSPKLMELTCKMASGGLVLSLEWFESVKTAPEFQHTICSNSSVSVTTNINVPLPEYLNQAQSIVEMELCMKQEDWRRMGKVFSTICQSSHHPNQVEQISGRITIALLSEGKDKLTLPFAAFAESVCPTGDDTLIPLSFLGRIGVSLMLRYHKTHQWAKGRRVVEVLSLSKVSFSTLKGLFGNEDTASRCTLVTVAAELFLLSGSVEGALNTLRGNDWFLSSSSWPCEPADLESRRHVLMRLAEKTSHRDTLEVLCNLPGIKIANALIDISRYSPQFDSHLRVCIDKQVLPVASDTVDFMLSHNLAVDQAMLHILFHKLGKQNMWLRAREVFRHSLSKGYYPAVSALPGFMMLNVPSHLGEMELALTFEMFITVNAAAILQNSESTTSCLKITLKRTQSTESEYLLAGSRLLSAAYIPQPKLMVLYTGVNPSQEQVFTLDIPSARCWLRRNHMWANEVWTH